MDTDRSCPRCGQVLASGGLTPTRIANWTALAFGVLMALFVVFIAMPQTQGAPPNDPKSGVANNVATYVANAIFIFGAVIVGWVIGRVVGAVVCRNR